MRIENVVNPEIRGVRKNGNCGLTEKAKWHINNVSIHSYENKKGGAMGRRVVDITGERFGNLTVIERDVDAVSKGAKWICKCDCGNIISVLGSHLRNGHTKSCGCLKTQREDLSNQRFGRLIVLREDDKDTKKCICKCDCGNIVSVNKSNLKRGFTTSCGCYHTEVVSKQRNDLTGKRFGRLTVVERVDNKDDAVRYLCRCDCGNEVVVRAASLMANFTKSCGCLKNELSSERFSLKLDGRKFGKLTVVKRAGTFVGSDGSKYSQWECLCDCGTTVVVVGHSLVSGRVTSCGCTASKGEEEVRRALNKMKVKFITQYSFDDLRTDKGAKLRFDFALMQDNNIVALVEYQGIQHFIEQPMGFGRQQREVTDQLKREYCNKNNIPLFEIVYDDDIELAVEDIVNILNLK